VPIFFIVSGMQFDLHALFATPTALLRVPLFLVLLLVVRGGPVLLLHRRDLPRRELVPLALCAATGLPLIVVITTIGVAEGRMRPVNAAALVAAGVLSVLLYPTLARMRLRPTPENAPVRLGLSRAEAGQPWLVAIEGDPGVGKTSLARRCLAGTDGLRVLWARASQAETDLDFGVVDQLFRTAGAVCPAAASPGVTGSPASSFAVGARLLEVVGDQQDPGAGAGHRLP
jgi:hypothetical protein